MTARTIFKVTSLEVARLETVARRASSAVTVKGLGDVMVEAQLAKNVPLHEVKTDGMECSLPLELIAERVQWRTPENSLPDGWAEHYINGPYIVGLFGPLLALSPHYEFRAFIHSVKAGIGRGQSRTLRLFCVPRAQVREQVVGLPAVETVPGALEDLLQGVTGEGSPLSYFALLTLDRSLESMGSPRTGVHFLQYEVVTRPETMVELPFWRKLFGSPKWSKDFLKSHGWEIKGDLPDDLLPRVHTAGEAVEVVMWLYREMAGEGFYEQRTAFEKGSYIPEITLSHLASGPRTIL